ncbi:N/A [soil metagenome]
MATPYSVTVLEDVASTQDEARRRMSRDRAAVVVAHRQSRGRGRSGAPWETADRAVAVSVALPSRGDRDLFVPLVAGVAARRVMGDAVRLKWPNDVLVGDDKVAGILVEVVGDTVVAGVGINLYWPGAPEGAGALEVHDPGPERGPEIAESWARTLLELLELEPWPRGEYVAGCSTLGRDISWQPGGRGRAVDVAEDGSLVVVDELGSMVLLSSGAVRHVRPRA